MADILIRGMEMPKTCVDCHDADLPTAIAWLGAKCPWANGIIDPGVYDLRHERHPDCPLHELPPHGDLTDRDAIVAHYRECERNIGSDVHLELLTVHNWIEEVFVYDLLNAPVFVPSNKEETE